MMACLTSINRPDEKSGSVSCQSTRAAGGTRSPSFVIKLSAYLYSFIYFGLLIQRHLVDKKELTFELFSHVLCKFCPACAGT